MAKVSLPDVKTALLDVRFRETLPDSLTRDIEEFLKNPSCKCNHPIYMKVIREAPDQLRKYFPAKDVVEPENGHVPPVNDWQVIN